jgi:hypothetical protein
MYPIGSAIMRAMVMRAAPIMRSPREGLLCRSASLVLAIVARADANILALTEAGGFFRQNYGLLRELKCFLSC